MTGEQNKIGEDNGLAQNIKKHGGEKLFSK
jgi:hypothetical protein